MRNDLTTPKMMARNVIGEKAIAILHGRHERGGKL
jgi:hypothetical protein